MNFLKIYNWAYKTEKYRYIYEKLNRSLYNIIIFTLVSFGFLFLAPTGLNLPWFVLFAGLAVFNSYKLGVYQRLGETHYSETLGPEIEYIN